MTAGGKKANAVVYTSHENVPTRRRVGAQYTFDGTQLYAEQDVNGNLSAINMIGGSLLERNEKPIINFAGGDISEWARDAVAKICGAKIMQGVSEDMFMPKETTTRAQAAVVLRRVYDLVSR